MIKVVIIEDEKHSQQQLLEQIADSKDDIMVLKVLDSVHSALEYFKNEPDVDLIFSDVQLPDGNSFDIFKNASISVPVIFVTGFDQFMVYAFEVNGIDYLLKPVCTEEFAKALMKYKMLEKHFSAHNKSLGKLLDSLSIKKKSRMIVKKGAENVSLKIDDIKMCYTDSKVVYIIDKDEKKFISDKTLNELEEELDSDLFFRANRQYIVNVNFVKSYRSYEKVKLLVDLDTNDRKHLVIISQITAPQFRKWISQS